jgi:hypothetical protein
MVKPDLDFPAWALILVLFVVLSVGLAAVSIRKNSDAIAVGHRALCSLKAERQSRVDETTAVLEHPNEGDNALIIRSLGRAILARSLSTSKQDLKALADVHCG